MTFHMLLHAYEYEKEHKCDIIPYKYCCDFVIGRTPQEEYHRQSQQSWYDLQKMAMQPGFEPPPTASSANTFRRELNLGLPCQRHALYHFVSCYTGAAQKIFSGTSFHKNDRKWIVKMHGSQSLIIPCYIALQAFSLSIPLHLHARCSLHWPSTGGSEEGTSIVIQTNCAYPLKNQQRGLVA